jgi:hypothetical protein
VEGLGGASVGWCVGSADVVHGLIAMEHGDRWDESVCMRACGSSQHVAAETGSFVEVWCASKRRKLLFLGEMQKLLKIVVPKVVDPSLVSHFLGMRSGKLLETSNGRMRVG